MLIIFAGAVQLAGAVHAAGPVQLGCLGLATFLGHGPLGYWAGGLGRQLGGLLAVAGLVGNLVHRRSCAERQVIEEHRLREEATAYLTLDLPPCALERGSFARLMSRTIATRSSFARAALLLRDNSGKLTVAGSAGMDDLTVEALNRWGVAAEGSLVPGAQAGVGISQRVGASSFVVELERRDAAGAAGASLSSLGCARVHLTPIACAAGLLGVIVVCAEPRQSTGRASDAARLRLLLEPIEALALHLSTQLSEVTKAQLPKGAAPRASRIWERTTDRCRARGPQLQQDGPASHVLTKLGKKTVLQMAPFLAAEKKPRRSTGVGPGLASAGVWQSGRGGYGEVGRPVA